MNIERLDFVSGSYYLNQQFKNDGAFAAGKIGANELLVVQNCLYYQQQNKSVEWNERILYDIYTGGGVFPYNENSILEFISILLQSLQYIDCYALWSMNNIQLEYDLIKHHNKNSVLVELMTLEPYYSGCPWTEHLKDKKVLVISPFVKSIEQQYKKRKELWNDCRILPDFELICLGHQLSPILGHISKYETWGRMVDDLQEQISKLDFDIALIGTGASSLPLTSFVKKLGKKAIHLGGALQILFGIKGGRWNDGMIGKYFYNDNWINPSDSEVPKDYKKMENGCYW